MSNQGHLLQHQSTFFHACLSILPKVEAVNVVRTILAWERFHGSEWAIGHMKLHLSALLGKRSPKIAYNKDGSFKGSFRPLYRLFYNKKRDRARISRFLKLHGLAKATITRSSYEQQASRLSLPNDPATFFFLKNIKPIAYRPPLRPRPPTGRVPCSRQKSCFYYDVPTMDHSRVVSDFQPLYSEFRVEFDRVMLTVEPPEFEDYDLIDEDFSELLFQRSVQKLVESAAENVVGRCVLLAKDGSLKQRLIFSPYAVIQMALQPLYDSLYALSQRLPNMYHMDQEAGKVYVHSLLQQGPVYSIDLKAASDNIPLEPQIQMLKEMFPYHRRLADLFEKVSRSVWITPHNSKLSMLRGQPMGLNVSFLSFSVYLYRLMTQHGITDFAQVGDDLVVRQGQLARHVLGRAGIEISEEKSLYGSFAEFCGTVIQPDGDLRSFKSRRSKYWTLIRSFGKKILPVVPKRYRFLYFLMKLPPPVGESFNPKVVACLPPSVVIELYDPLKADQYAIASLPKGDEESYIRSWESVFEFADVLGVPVESPELRDAVNSTTMLFSYGPEFMNLRGSISNLNLLAESANSQKSQTNEFVRHHLRVLTYLLRPFVDMDMLRRVPPVRPFDELTASHYYKLWRKVGHFVSPNPPRKPLPPKLMYDTVSGSMKYY